MHKECFDAQHSKKVQLVTDSLVNRLKVYVFASVTSNYNMRSV